MTKRLKLVFLKSTRGILNLTHAYSLYFYTSRLFRKSRKYYKKYIRTSDPDYLTISKRYHNDAEMCEASLNALYEIFGRVYNDKTRTEKN